ncbi:MAG: hypothetical protein R3F59_25590 [Myxococcota bacterium]
MRLSVVGTPIGGEDAREAAWVKRIHAAAAGAAPCAAVSLSFTLAAGRTVDVDNLARPAMTALQRAGVFQRGFRALERLVATKHTGQPEGLLVALDPPDAPLPAPPELTCTFATLPPSEAPQAWMRAATDRVRAQWPYEPVTGDVFADIRVTSTSTRSLVGLLKPALDILCPYLGAGTGPLAFTPRDEQVVWLQIRRVHQPDTLCITLGR